MTVGPQLACPRCGEREAAPKLGQGCVRCQQDGVSVNLAVVTDLEAMQALLASDDLERRPFSQWRYAEALAFPAAESVSLGEGGTPLIEAPALARRVGGRRMWIKDESQNPTWSFKDRAASLAASVALQSGARGLVASSTGNAAAATAAYARRAGLPALILFAKRPPVAPTMEAFVRAFGGVVVAAETKPERWKLMRHAVDELGFFPNSNFADPPLGNTPWAVAGYRAIGLEIWEQLGRRAPDEIVFPVGHGDAIYGVFTAFRDLAALGYAQTPALGGAEVYGSLTRALSEGGEAPPAMPVDRNTVAFSIATSQSTYQALSAVRDSGGWVEQVSDEQVQAAQRILLETEGLLVEPASAASLAALVHRREAGSLDREAEIVIVNTSSGLKALDQLRPEREVPLVRGPEELQLVLNGRQATGVPSERRSIE